MAQLTIGQPPEPHLPASAEVPSARRVGLLVASMAYAAITLVVLWQQMRHLTSVPEHHDPLFSIWRLAWVAHQLPRHPAALFDGNMFYPELRTLAYSDAMLLPGLIAAPLIWAGVPAVVAYNLLLYASFVAAGAAMFLLVRSLTQDTASAWCAGLVFAFAPYRFDHYIHFELLWTFWMPLAFAALHQTLYRGRYRDAALTGIFAGCQMLSSIYYGIFLGIVLCLGTAVQFLIGPVTSRRRAVLCIAVAGACALVLIVPYSIPYRENAKVLHARSAAEITDYSARWGNYVASPPENYLYGWTHGRWGGNEKQLFTGITVLLLALIGVIPPAHRLAIVYTVVLVWAVDSSFGTNGLSHQVFYRFVPLYNGLRVPARWGSVVTCALAVLAGYGVQRVARRSVHGTFASVMLGLTLSGLLMSEFWTEPLQLARQPSKASDLYHWLAQQPQSIVIELPLPAADSLPGYEARYLYSSIFHWHTLVNGYSGYYPESHIQLLETMRTFPDTRSLTHLRGLGVGYVILHPELMRWNYLWITSQLERTPDVIAVGAFMSNRELARVYALTSKRMSTALPHSRNGE